MYGNKSLDGPITIGKINVAETKKFSDFEHWHKYYKTYDMWAKDLDAYIKAHNKPTYNGSRDVSAYVILERYRPKSIR